MLYVCAMRSLLSNIDIKNLCIEICKFKPSSCKLLTVGILKVFSCYIGSVHPKSTVSDYIEKKPTMGGKPILCLSMSSNNVSLSKTRGSNAKSATSDLNLLMMRPQNQVSRSLHLYLIR